MPQKPRPTPDPWTEAATHLRQADAHWAPLIDRVGPCLIRPQKDRFGTLVRAIIGQQISSKAATSIDAKLKALAGAKHTPKPLLALGETGLRSVGLSGVKARYVLNLAEAVELGTVPLASAHKWDDQEVVARLTSIKGIGVWTAEMFLIFSLARPDVFPVGDLGVRSALRDRLGLPDLPKPSACVPLGEPWRPFRSIASWYLWKSLDPAYRNAEAGKASDAP